MIVFVALTISLVGIGIYHKVRTNQMHKQPIVQQPIQPVWTQTTDKLQQQPASSDSKTKTNNSTTSQPKTPVPTTSTQTNNDTYSPPPTDPCPDYLKQSFTDVYNANIGAENINYQSNKQSISEYWNSKGLLYSGSAQAALAAEDQRHQNALTSIESSYQQQLGSHHCS